MFKKVIEFFKILFSKDAKCDVCGEVKHEDDGNWSYRYDYWICTNCAIKQTVGIIPPQGGSSSAPPSLPKGRSSDCTGPTATRIEMWAIPSNKTRAMWWRPIESAPKDGTLIQVAWWDHSANKGYMSIVHWDNHLEAWELDSGDLCITAEYWMPLPFLPDEFEKRKKPAI